MKLLQIGKAQISIITYATNAIMQSVSLTLTEPTDIPVLTFLSQPASQPNTHEWTNSFFFFIFMQARIWM